MTQSMMEKHPLAQANWVLVLLTIALAGLGLINLYSASAVRLGEGISVDSHFQKQCLWVLLGAGCMLICMFFDYRRLISSAEPLLLLSIALLLLVLFTGGTVRRWLPLGPVNFQPSEAVKISVLLVGAKILSRGKDPLNWKELGGVMLVGLVPAALILKQPDLGTAVIVLLILGGMILYRGVKIKIIKVCVLVLILSPVALVKLVIPNLLDYQRDRILGFVNPEKVNPDSIYQNKQAKIAIGSGQTWGKGYLEGTQSKLRFLPAKHTDFAIAVFGEEWGFAGSVALVALFCFFLLSIYATAREARDSFGSIFTAGVFFYFFWQIFVNIGMVLGMMPVVGIPLPFISYGGSASLVNFCLVGLVLNVSMRRFVFRAV
ncbi:MAG: rod shape-determining protein RodA [Deltaproteobacteria bacterium]|jgi:rod shape determining protein RodA|nr:rod shape-determining protein RodA [Deltaproteobacteria bacterium]